jgi:DNA repair protein RadC
MSEHDELGALDSPTPLELLSLVLGGTSAREGPAGVAGRLLQRHGLRGLADLGPEGWRAQSGLSPASAARMCAVFELGRRAWGADAEPRPRVASPRQAWERVRWIAGARKEHLVGLYLDAQNGLLATETLSIGSLNTTRTQPREVLFPALAHLALGFLLAHNHPSGCLEPSPEDVDFTQAMRRAGEVMGIELYDHLIVGRQGYTSLRERGLL